MRTLAEKVYFDIVGMESMLDAARTFLSVVLPVHRDDFRCPRFKNLADYIASNVLAEMPGEDIAITIKKWADEVAAEIDDPAILHVSSPIAGTVKILLNRQQVAEAERVCRMRLGAEPADADAWWMLSVALGKQDKMQEAIAAQIRSLDILPLGARYAAHASDLNHLGLSDDALKAMNLAHGLRPWDMRILCELAGHEHAHGHYASAMIHLKEVLKQSDVPLVKAKAHLLAAACLADGSTDCISSIRKAIKLAPHWNFAKLVLGEELIRAGQWKEGWEAYSHIEQTWLETACLGSAPAPREIMAEPPAGPLLWNGEPLEAKRLLVRSWAGFGDQIQFARFAVDLTKNGAYVYLACKPQLKALFESLPESDHLLVVDPDFVDADYQTYPYRLPSILDATPETLSGQPYLAACPTRIDRWSKALSGDANFKIGICWKGNPAYVGDRERSAPREVFEALRRDGISLYSLVPGEGDSMPSMPDIKDFADTAALIENLDLVVTVDTAVAHLAGAMGKPVWLLLPFKGEWRWGTDPEKTAWYGSMRLWRQNEPGNWNELLKRVSVELQERMVAHV